MCVLLQLLYYSFSSLCYFDPICNIVIYLFFSFKFCICNMCFVNKRKIILKKKKKKKRNRSKNFQNHLYSQPVLTSFDKRQICEEILKELRFNGIKNLLSLFFLHGFITMCNLKKRLIRSAF